MGGRREDTDALNQLGVQYVGNLLGIRLPAEGTIRCPFKGHDDRRPSFEVCKGGRYWVCYACGNKGGPIDLVKTYLGITFIEAKKWLAEKSGLDRGKSGWGRSPQLRMSRPISRKNQNHTQPREVEESAYDHELYASFLAQSPLRSSGKLYLQNRGFSDAIISRFSIGQVPDIAMIRTLIADFGFNRVEVAGLLTKSSTQSSYWPIFPKGSLLFPYLEGGRVAYFQARLINETEKEKRWRNLNHRRRRLYNVDVLTDINVRRVAICEGVTDVLSATQLGCEAIGLIGVGAGLSESEMIALRGKQIDLLLDWDTAGEKRATTLGKELKRFGVAATRKSAPQSGATDINDYLRQGNKRI
ncbi:CHC2 zinc finger domain-containing protein [Thalassospira indica]|uniref:Toprim domain-containing protein n=1 Tax=Thalassospira indica TaxID=1891279 RepID=A0ABM6XZW8_9PROT|nr:CHC2 zinc finger domain-containing protein [Thalassospira indica]AXO15247.1 hypothetical protein DY252_14165 [Thalassospira indica]OAZ08706.1 hypothetical protein TH15_21270 [Thalassospira profundimaris]